jgi:hypothetical protein
MVTLHSVTDKGVYFMSLNMSVLKINIIKHRPLNLNVDGVTESFIKKPQVGVSFAFLIFCNLLQVLQKLFSFDKQFLLCTFIYGSSYYQISIIVLRLL